MVSLGHLLGYALVALVLIVVPGPTVLFIVGRALAYGRRAALATICGNSSGSYLVAVFVALGVGTVIERSVAIFTLIKFAGALYLIWLGVQAIRRRKAFRETFDAGRSGYRGWTAMRQGFIVGATNPKSLILFGAILPQFVDRSAGHVQVQMLLLALVSTAIGLVSDSLWAITAGAARDWFARSPRRVELVGGTGGLAMIAVGLTVAATGRND